MKTVLIICENHLQKAPRFIMEVNALRNQYNILAAGLSGDTAKGSPYYFIDIAPRSNWTKKNPTFHLKLPVLLRKAVSFFIRVTMEQDSYILNLFRLLYPHNFDLIIVHHLQSLPVAFKLAKAKKVKVIFNAHEYYPAEFEDKPDWLKNTQPYNIKICSEYLPKLDAMFVVGQIIADEYKKVFGVDTLIITNAKKYQYLTPVPVGKKIRIIHHGAAIRSRGMEEMITMMGILGEGYTLDLMLTPADEQYLNELKASAAKYANISFRPIVPTANIAEELNNFDLGCYILKPSNYNNLNALPNKFFEFIQARLAIAIGPSPEMALLVKKYDLGVVAKEFTPQSMAEEIRKISPEKIMYYKNRSHENAHELSAEKNEKVIRQTVEKCLNA